MAHVMSTRSDDTSHSTSGPVTVAVPKQGAPSPRKQQILVVAANLFAKHGYNGTSIRLIGEEAGVLGGSLYHHIKSKESLFVEVHNMAVDAVADAIEKSLEGIAGPWEKLEKACSVFLDLQLQPERTKLPWIRELHNVPENVRMQIIARRDEFEVLFDQLIADLNLSPEQDRSVYRNTLLTLLINTSTWYRPGKLTPEEIAHQIVMMLNPPTR